MPPPPSRGAGLAAAIALIAQFALIWSTFFILSSAVNWPASLDDPAAVALPRVLAHGRALMLGYGGYLLAALLLVPATAALNVRLGLTGAVGGLTLALAVLSAMAKTLGISRWLFAMPGLAKAYVAPDADQTAVALIFETLNAYAGGIGEVLGVGLFSGVWTLIIAVAVFNQGGGLTKGLGLFAGLAGLSLFLTVPAGFGVDLGPVLTISNITWQFALLGIGLWALTPERRA